MTGAPSNSSSSPIDTSALPLKAWLVTAMKAAFAAGDAIMEKYQRLEQVRKKGAVDLVTEADLAAETIVVNTIKSAFPDHAIVAEEGDYAAAKPGTPTWIIDPIDGTTNYVHSLPIFGVSIGCRVGDETVVGVVHNPAMYETYSASLGDGAYLNEAPIHVSDTPSLQDALLVTGFSYTHDEFFAKTFDLYREYYFLSQGVRRLGAAALDLCYVAAGRFDAFYEARLKPWDICAGDLICREAGGKTTDWRGGPLPSTGERLVATNTLIHQEVLDVLAMEAYSSLR